MADATGEAKEPPLRVAFDRRIKLEFHGSRITSDAGLLAYRELDDALGLTVTAASILAEGRHGKNIRHHLLSLLRQAVYGRLAGYNDVNDAERLARDPAMRAIVGREGTDRPAASTSQMGRFETEWLATEANLAALTELSGAWIDRVHGRRPPDGIILDMDGPASPTHGAREGSAWNGHFGCTCYHPLFIFNQFGDLERCALRPGNAHSAAVAAAPGMTVASNDRRPPDGRGVSVSDRAWPNLTPRRGSDVMPRNSGVARAGSIPRSLAGCGITTHNGFAEGRHLGNPG